MELDTVLNMDCMDQGGVFSLYYEHIIIVTDPPFNIGYHYESYRDNMGKDDYISMLSDIIDWSPTVMVNYPETLYELSAESGRVPTRSVAWVYNSNTRRQHREINFYGVEPDFKRVRQPYKNPNGKRVKKLIANGHTGAPLYDWWNVNQVKNVSKEKTGHPCQMPLKVMENIIGVLPTDENTIIVDPFCGSGTTLVAAKHAGLHYLGYDIDPHYCDIARRRLKENTNGK